MRATRGERLALENAAEALAVLDFVRDKVLAAARPRDQGGGLGITATVREAVDAAEPGIAGSFADRPAVEASIRATISASYRYLGEPERAVRQDERALALRRRALGPDHPDTLTSMNNLARSYYEAGRLDESLSLSEEALPRLRSRLGAGHIDTLDALNNLASAYQATGRFADAVPLFEDLVAQRRSRLGPDEIDTLIAMDNLAGAYRDAGRIHDALPLYEETRRRFEARLGPDHPDTLVALNNLALAYKDVGRIADAVPLYEEALRRRRARLGPDHLFTLQSQNNLAQAYRAAGRIDEALPLYRQALAGRRAQLGPDHAHTLQTLNALARAHLPGEPVRAESLLRESLAMQEKKRPDDWSTFATRSLLGECLLEQKRYAEAEPLLIAGYEGLKAREVKMPAPYKAGLAEAESRIIRLYGAWGKDDRAAEWRARLSVSPKPN
jgi:tetratricopeptide (TPR) repeat protein